MGHQSDSRRWSAETEEIFRQLDKEAALERWAEAEVWQSGVAEEVPDGPSPEAAGGVGSPMGYGVNRWQSGAGRAKAAGKRSASARKRGKRAKSPKKSARSARRAPKRRAKRAPKRAPKRSAAKRPKKAKLYTRYNPLDGTKARVRADDPRYLSWLPRKPSKKKLRQERASQLLGGSRVGGVIVEEVARKAATRTAAVARRSLAPVLKGAGTAALGAAGIAPAVAAAQLAALTAAGAIAYGITRLVLSRDPAAAEQQVNAWFREARKELIRRTGSPDWASVPKQARDKLVGAWKEGLVKAQVGLSLPRY